MRLFLKHHAAAPPRIPREISVELFATDWEDVLLSFTISPAGGIVLPEAAVPERTDGLWETTCFEFFLRKAGAEAYLEFNLSPSGKWAAYWFDGYRSGMQPLHVAVHPHIQVEAAEPDIVIDADIDLREVPPEALKASIAAVIEEADGTKSYWALAHPAEKPDFHHPDGFVLTLPHS